MKANLTELVFLLDRSGSMESLVRNTLSGFNALLQEQQEAPGAARMTTVLFDTEYQLLHDRQDIRRVRPLTEREYQPQGYTALYDAMGRTITKIVAAQAMEKPRADRVLFVVITDGLENASQEYSASQIRQMVWQCRKELGWEFLFLGANIDAIAAADVIGIPLEFATNFEADGPGVQLCYEAVSAAASCLRSSSPLERSWKERVERDHRQRGGRR